LQEYAQQELILEKGTVLYLTTDGYIDQNDSNRRRLGTKMFTEILDENSDKT
jgi:serine phosphatase RsbU (regulator of sigma subunit)